MKKIVALIPARSGSKGFPHKNLAKIGDKSLLELAVNLCTSNPTISDIYVSTDSTDYEKVALKAGAKSLGLRSKDLSSDSAKSVDVALDFLNTLKEKYQYLLLVQPTSPCRSADDILKMYQLLESDPQYEAVVSVEKLEEPHPHKVKKLDNQGKVFCFIAGTSSETPRQQLPPAYRLNGSFYLIRIESLVMYKTFLPEGKTKGYVMEKGVNIDSEIDFWLLEKLIQKKLVRGHLLN